MKRAPYYSERPGDLVYHDNDNCDDGQKVTAMYRVEGTGGRPLCKRCAQLDGARRTWD